MAAAKGNNYAAYGRRWRDAIEKAINRRISDGRLQGLEDLADKLLDAVIDGDMSAVRELGDRLDGKAHQTQSVDATLTGTLIQKIEQVIVDPKA